MNDKGFYAYLKYLALTRHFDPSSNYDYFKYNGHVKANEASFQKRKDAIFFAIVENKHKHDLPEFIVANIVQNDFKVFPKMLVSKEAEKNFQQWKLIQESLSYKMQEQIRKVLTEDGRDSHHHFNDLFVVKENEHPILLKMFLAGDINREVLIALNKVLNFFPHWCDRLSDDFIWNEEYKRLKKYEPFVACDKSKLTKALRDFVRKEIL